MVQTKEHANWHMKARLLKYHEDIDAFTHRKTWWAKTLRFLCATPLMFIASPIYNQTVGKLERKFHALFTPYEVIEQEGNCLLNTGIQEMWALITGHFSGAAHIYDNAATQIGVGDSATAADPAQTDLLGDPNKLYKAMETGFPTAPPVSQKITCKSSFGTGDANYVWNEWVIKHATSLICLNRKVESLGTKSTGTWTLEVDITLT